MPLEDGLASFNDATYIVSVESRPLLQLFEKREDILRFYRANPELLAQPYRIQQKRVPKKVITRRADPLNGHPEIFSTNWEVEPFIEDSCSENRIYAALCDAGCGLTTVDALPSFAEWKDVYCGEGLLGAAEAGGYALIDFSLYLVHLLNIYLPNEGLIANLFATNVRLDALGRRDVEAAKKAVAKVVRRSLGQPRRFAAEGRAADILQFVMRETSQTTTRQAAAGIGFERACEEALRSAGFEVHSTPATGDYGADLIAFKDGIGYAIQCKDTRKPAGIRAVQEAVAARRHYYTDYAVVCCSGGFTHAAVELATSNKVVLCLAEHLVRDIETS